MRARGGRSGPRAARRAAPLVALFAVALFGCTALELFQTRGARQQAAELAYLHGRVSTAFPSTHPLVVGVLRIDCPAGRALVAEIARAGPRGAGPLPPALQEQVAALRDHVLLVAHVVRERPGEWYARVAPGCYGVLAFEDTNEDGRYEDEPGLTAADPARFLEVAAGERVDVPDLVIPQDGRLAISDADPAAEQVLGLVARSQEEQHLVSVQSVAVEGALADLADPRFGAENGRLGYFDPLGFGWRVGPGVYFLEDYDPHKIPVLFVHGALGHPSEFEFLVKELDRTRYQPWFFFYPSGARLGSMGGFLSELVTRLRLRLRFERMAVVAHSMGGLVARSFVLKHHAEAREDPVELFVAISTPWDGSEAAQGANRPPSPLFPVSMRVPMWQDIATGSRFLNDLFYVDGTPAKGRRPLPTGLEFDLLFGVLDRTISPASAARWEAVDEARDRWPLLYDHTGILRSPEASALLARILARHFEGTH